MGIQKSILIVEDEPAIRFAIKYELSQDGYKFRTAEDISQAFLSVNSDNPDLIILDIMLPGGRDEGFKLCRRLKADASTRNIPIIILTARPAQDEVRARNAGADKYFTKPPNMMEFKEAIQGLLEKT